MEKYKKIGKYMLKKLLLIFRIFLFFKKKNKKQDVIKSEREIYLEKRLNELENSNFEDYISSHMLVDTGDGFQIKFLGEKTVNIISKCFYYLIKDSSNYLVFTFKSPDNSGSIDVYVVKEGQLVPADKVQELEEELKYLKDELNKLSN
jgi:hypothetical protein